MKILIIVLLVLVLSSLFSGLFFLMKDQGRSDRVVKALTVRIALSITVFVLLMAGYYFGLIPADRL